MAGSWNKFRNSVTYLVIPGSQRSGGAMFRPRFRIALLQLIALMLASLLQQGARAQQNLLRPPSKPLVDFKEGSPAPFGASGALQVSHDHAANGRLSLRLNSGYAVWDGLQDWTGFDLFKTEVFNAS